MTTVTPMMAQYMAIKADHPDALLFYRMGDFYEMFFDDAAAASEALDIALTKRGKHDGDDIPMCGVPVHSAESYLLTLIRKGFRVAVCEQMENPAEAKKRGNKSVVHREVVRLVTPGTLTEESLLEARRHNYLAALSCLRDDWAISWADISTGAFHVMPLGRARIGAELARLVPSEVLVSEAVDAELRSVFSDLGIYPTVLGRASFDSSSAETRLCSLYQVQTLTAFGNFSRCELSAMGALVDYLDITQKGRLPLLRPPQSDAVSRLLQIDAATRRNLELTHSMSGGRAGSLLSVIDRTVTPGGARLLERRVSSPSRVLPVIHERLDAIDWAMETPLSSTLRDRLRKVPDLDRALSRLGLDRGGPRDLAAVRNALEQAEEICDALSGADLPSLLTESRDALGGHEALLTVLDSALVAEPPLLARDGGFIAPDYDAALDDARRLRDEGRGIIASMQARYAERAGVPSLKIKHNNVLGYFIETTATHADKMMSPPLNDSFIHRQTTANQVRFTTVELSELETRILNASGECLEIEKRLFSDLREAILAKAPQLSETGLALSEIDLALGLADLARQHDWTRPRVDDSRAFDIRAGRHPVVERALQQQNAGAFIANDCALMPEGDGAAVTLLTGPNMAGKSTYLRQNALIALLAQMGSYVPAHSAHVGLFSQVFSRVGASDDLARGRSTFMVEMVETAAILNQADDRALVILDEIGRGTATYDGLSIAWATLEYLQANNRVRALFATHYHELTQLAGKLEGVRNATVAVREWNGEVIFLHEVHDGAADRSYGVQVAQLAGLPKPVIARARSVLEALEKGERDRATPKALIDDLPLFSAAAQAAPTTAPTGPSPVEQHLRDLNPDDLSPRDALRALYDLKALTHND
ncbi:DNA mismatch repair protein MutS [Salipiger aestuarii]|nr:DNA mismatch repair protein MutS [Salipiger aestuarii]KAA8609986.1 DNA mismatch repair protein MutS [Salipiger aestuarii]KAA8616310.1 DNA mismatch repair protein MutS [Salipiger aestuarii]KAB2543246.1 DNA mismatch repair protein MutS [Salipiger aestuarii]